MPEEKDLTSGRYTISQLKTYFDKVTGEYVGYCGIKNINVENWELVIELLKKHRHRGYGYHALVVMLNALMELTGAGKLTGNGNGMQYFGAILTSK